VNMRRPREPLLPEELYRLAKRGRDVHEILALGLSPY
jgi:hypothetical protein